MRGLSRRLLTMLSGGILAPLISLVKKDVDLDFQIREDYFNIYYKGNSLLRLTNRLRVKIDTKFTKGLEVPIYLTGETIDAFIELIPQLKARIDALEKHSLELEYEQLMIRANNREERDMRTDYFMIDRQYGQESSNQLDVIGFYRPRDERLIRGIEVPLCIFEIKYFNNNDIQTLDQQLSRYYALVAADTERFANEMTTIYQQKVELGLMPQLDIFFSKDINTYQFIVVLIDYNPNSTLLDRSSLRALPFANQIRIFKTGFGMWQQDLQRITSL